MWKTHLKMKDRHKRKRLLKKKCKDTKISKMQSTNKFQMTPHGKNQDTFEYTFESLCLLCVQTTLTLANQTRQARTTVQMMSLTRKVICLSDVVWIFQLLFELWPNFTLGFSFMFHNESILSFLWFNSIWNFEFKEVKTGLWCWEPYMSYMTAAPKTKFEIYECEKVWQDLGLSKSH